MNKPVPWMDLTVGFVGLWPSPPDWLGFFLGAEGAFSEFVGYKEWQRVLSTEPPKHVPVGNP